VLESLSAPNRNDDADRPLYAAETAMPLVLMGLGALDGGHTGHALVLAGIATSFGAPSPGELRDDRVFSLGMGVRALGVSMMAYDGTRTNHDDSVFVGGTALTIAGTLYDVVTAPNTLRRHARVLLAPAAVPLRRGVGLGLFARF
jgi:hypothetical protein